MADPVEPLGGGLSRVATRESSQAAKARITPAPATSVKFVGVLPIDEDAVYERNAQR